jgi:hypothetical protein
MGGRVGTYPHGGRPLGSRNKTTITRELQARAGVEAAVTSGILPLDVMLARMRNEPLPDGKHPTDEQFEAAVAAAPYIHPKINSASVEVRSDNVHYVVSDEPMTVEEWVAKYGADSNDVAALRGDDEDEEPSVN